MPVTPFHFGPGLLLKAVAPAVFSLTCFVATQVLIDVETAYNLLSGRYPLHRFFHSIPGSVLAGLGVAFVLWLARGWLAQRFKRSSVLFRGEF